MSNVATARSGAVAIVRFDRPEKKNALTSQMYADLVAAFAAAEEDREVRVVVLTGAGGVFTAGNDLMDFVANPPAGPESPVFRFLLATSRFPKPIVAAVDGAAVGLGTTVLLHCDLVVASTRARFILPFVPLGIVPEFASSLLLPARVGWQRAAEWLLLGDAFDADAAYRAGLVNRVVEPEATESTAMELATALATRPPEAVRLSKQLMKAPLAAAVQDAMEREAAVFVERLRSDEAMAAMTAFLTRPRK
jgi:enoyl-CoA hydratase/carnithine racemase